MKCMIRPLQRFADMDRGFGNLGDELTLVILSWVRIGNVKMLVNYYNSLDRIGEIIIFNNNSKFNISKYFGHHNKVTVIQSTHDLGLYSRFAAAALSRNRGVIFIDDDIFVPDPTIESLYYEWRRYPDSCHGIIGRETSNGYRPIDTYGEVKVILTRCLVTSKTTCIKALEFSRLFDHLDCIPRGNGEDIIISYCAILETGLLNKAYPLPYQNLEGHGGSKMSASAIHQRFPGHYVHRQTVVNMCERILRDRNQLKKSAFSNILKITPIFRLFKSGR